MPSRPDPLAVPLDAAGRTVRAEVVRGPRERDGRWYWRAREEHQGQRQDVSERVLEGGRWLTAAEAHRALVLYAARITPQAPQARLRTLGEVLGAWIYAQRQRRDITPATLTVIEARSKMLASVPALAAHPTTDRRTMREALERGRDELLTSHASTTVAASMGLLRRAWAWAEERDYVAGAMPLVRTRAKLTRAKPIASPGETAAILATLSGWHAVALRVAVATGARTSELTSIDRTSIQRLDEGWLELHGKTGPRAVYVDPEGPAAVALRAWLADHERLAPRWGSSSLRQVLRRACRRVLVPTYTPYALRRAFAGKLRRAGMDVTERAAVMGHSAAVHLASYDRAQPEDLRAGMKGAKLEELPDGAVLLLQRRRA